MVLVQSNGFVQEPGLINKLDGREVEPEYHT